VQSTFLEPLYFANYLLTPAALLFSLFLVRFPKRIGWLYAGLFSLCAVNSALTVSRGGYLGLAVALFVVGLLSIRGLLRKEILLALGAFLLVFAIIVPRFLSYGDASGMNIETFTSHVRNVFYGASYNERIETFEHAIDAFRSSPLVGIGPGAFGPFVAMHPLIEPTDGWKIVNNEPLELLAENGALGLLCMLAAWYIIALRSVTLVTRMTESNDRAILVGLTGAFFGSIVQYQTFSTIYSMQFWVLVGLLLAYHARALRNTHDTHSV
jgi:O-antigen ligase